MNTITAALLLLGFALTGFGTFAFLAAAPAAPDPETLRLAYLAAWAGQRIATPGLLLWFVAWPTTAAGYTLLFGAALAALAVSFLVTRAAPELIQRAATWSI